VLAVRTRCALRAVALADTPGRQIDLKARLSEAGERRLQLEHALQRCVSDRLALTYSYGDLAFRMDVADMCDRLLRGKREQLEGQLLKR
jgi:hypothetical protein